MSEHIDPEQWTTPEGAAEAIMDTWTGGLMSAELFGAIVASALLISLWIYSDDMALPTVVGMLVIAPFGYAYLPGQLQQVASGVIAVGVAAAVFELGRRHVT